MTSSRQPVVIIGAGPAGLTAGYELAKAGRRSVVLEASEYVGGLSRTQHYRGYLFDIGGHRFFSKIPLINALWRELLDEEFLLRPRLSRIHYNEHFFDYPLKPRNALAGLGPVESLRVCASYAQAKLFPYQDEATFEQWVSNRFGTRLYEIFFKTYTEKVWGMPCREISADWAAQRIKNLSLKEALRHALLGAKQAQDGQTVTTLIERFHYPRLGPGMMWECCEGRLADHGSPTVRGMPVERIRHAKGRVECVTARTLTGERTDYEGSEFVSTMPLRELIHALDPRPPDHVVQAADRLRYRDYLTVVLVVNRPAVFPDNWIYIHSPSVKMGRIQNYKNWSPFMVPDPSRTSLGLEYFLWDKDEEWSWPDDRLIDLGIEECARLRLIHPAEVEDGTVVRMEKAYPVYDHQYQNSVAIVRDYLAAFDNLQTIGRNGLHRYNNQDHSMLTGIYAARNILGDRLDVWSVNTEQDYLEEGQTADAKSGDRLVPVRVPLANTEPTALAPDEVLESAFAKVDAVALGVALGIVMGVGLFLATAILLVKGGPVVGPTLSLLHHYLPGFSVSWSGALMGVAQATVWGFVLGYACASCRNWALLAYAQYVRWRRAVESRRKLLDKV